MFGSFSKTFRVAQRPSIFYVSDVPSIIIWYDASLQTYFQPSNILIGNNITQWNDKSKYVHNANPKSGNSKPTWSSIQGISAVLFDGINQNLEVNNTTWADSLTGYTLFVVARASQLSAQPLTISDKSDFGIYYNQSRWTVRTQACTGTSTISGDTTKFHIFTHIYDGTKVGNSNKLKFRYDRNPVTLTYTGNVSATTSINNSQFFIGWNGLSNYYKGYISEIILTNTTLVSSNIAIIENYLKNKYSL